MKTHFMYIFFFENHAVFEILWKNNVMASCPQITIWRVCTACWMTKATDTHSEYVIFIDFPLQQMSHERTLMLRYTYTACLVVSVFLNMQHIAEYFKEKFCLRFYVSRR